MEERVPFPAGGEAQEIRRFKKEKKREGRQFTRDGTWSQKKFPGWTISVNQLWYNWLHGLEKVPNPKRYRTQYD